MTSKRIDILERKQRVLGVTVKQYIDTIAPVSSAYLVNEYFSDLSSATIRNILSELEGDGYLMHPHTSAGRVPTQRGYRFYVDNLVHEIQLLEDEKKRIRGEYIQEKNELNEILQRVSQVVSDATHYTSIVSVDGWGTRLILSGTQYIVEYPNENDVHKIKNILEALERKERIYEIINQQLEHRIESFIGAEIECSQMSDCSLVVSQYKTQSGPSGRIAVLGPTRMDYQKVYSTLDYVTQLMEEVI
ncbi:MAG: transcriptional regulator of heat shock response [Lysobacterales bacterium]|jgi:transcriptional regulator of heat shock response